ncbi:hypothetical protein D1AOALGA4SA_3941 [Olavius algarvensis Delta 1 endosymbiont]|nr:hypothetical protein D1AOALGA4SA_3941 [Olavius algarvensis Delta 1 endosymbiont]
MQSILSAVENSRKALSHAAAIDLRSKEDYFFGPTRLKNSQTGTAVRPPITPPR